MKQSLTFEDADNCFLFTEGSRSINIVNNRTGVHSYDYASKDIFEAFNKLVKEGEICSVGIATYNGKRKVVRPFIERLSASTFNESSAEVITYAMILVAVVLGLNAIFHILNLS